MKYMLTMAALAAATALPATAAPIMLYDGSLGTLPENQGWLSVTATPGSESAGTGSTIFDTTSDATWGAILENGAVNFDDPFNPTNDFVNPAFPQLDRTTGYTIGFTGKLDAETHQGTTQAELSDYNAGWSLTVVSEDKLSVVIGIRDNEVFSYSPDDGEEHNVAITNPHDTHTFDLHVQGSQFVLSLDGTPLFTDSLFDDSADFANYAFMTPSYVALGDQSDLAGAKYELSSFYVTVPEPWAIFPVILGLAILVRPRQRRA